MNPAGVGAGGPPRCAQRRPGYQAAAPGPVRLPCARPADHAGPHMDITGATWATTIDVEGLDAEGMHLADSADGNYTHLVLGEARLTVPTTGDAADRAAEAMWRLSDLAHEAAHRAAWRIAAAHQHPRRRR
ncbi:hypothetical protein HNR23_000286 [Nocardiopsis mwathae]|uniref:Uncharacterized protein n=1 Tax=Nocardiopsis mwathae TaxID=1472723 RepID=A0A7X0D3Z0_9ACTN|nr:hypothetical protein [Nocardiopsis mwathae]MBB6170226.1 hypothetical protein [Nocardiopsis mwathae]